MKEFTNNTTIYWLGKNATDNWNLIKESNKNWIWIHLDKFPSGHVIICKDSNIVTNDEIIYGCELCISNSKYKLQKNLGVIYCKINNLLLGEEVGSVYFNSKRKIKKIYV